MFLGVVVELGAYPAPTNGKHHRGNQAGARSAIDGQPPRWRDFFFFLFFFFFSFFCAADPRHRARQRRCRQIEGMKRNEFGKRQGYDCRTGPAIG